jgi:hypothetical protein
MAKTSVTIPARKTIPAQSIRIPAVHIPEQIIELSAETIPEYTFEVEGSADAAPASSGGGSSAFYKPTSQAAFQLALQTAIDNQQMLFLEPGTVLTITSEMTFTLPGSDGDNTKRPGLWAYGSRFEWQSDNTGIAGMMTFTTSGENCYFHMAGLSGYGAGYAHTPANHFVKLIAHNSKALRDFRLVDLTCKHFYNGLWLEGEVFEGYIDSFSCEWVRDAGIHIEHTAPDVLSNIFIDKPSIIRCPASLGPAKGIYLKGNTNSVAITNGNFISLDGPAIHAEGGVKRVRDCSFENCGNTAGICVQIDSIAFFTRITGCDAANTQGKMLYFVKSPTTDPTKFTQSGNDMYNGTVLAP